MDMLQLAQLSSQAAHLPQRLEIGKEVLAAHFLCHRASLFRVAANNNQVVLRAGAVQLACGRGAQPARCARNHNRLGSAMWRSHSPNLNFAAGVVPASSFLAPQAGLYFRS